MAKFAFQQPIDDRGSTPFIESKSHYGVVTSCLAVREKQPRASKTSQITRQSWERTHNDHCASGAESTPQVTTQWGKYHSLHNGYHKVYLADSEVEERRAVPRPSPRPCWRLRQQGACKLLSHRNGPPIDTSI